MLADLQQTKDGFVARYERHLDHAVENVWSMLTDNDKLKQWFPDMQVDDLRVGGVIKFDMQDGTFEEMNILEVETNAVLSYTWGEDRVRFELEPVSGGTRLILIEQLTKLTDHTPKDLAGWHVCLDEIKALLDGKNLDSRNSEWEKWYKAYTEALNRMTTSE